MGDSALHKLAEDARVCFYQLYSAPSFHSEFGKSADRVLVVR